MSALIQYSGGIGSWAAAQAFSDCQDTTGMRLLFVDVLIEDGDLYRFLIESACSLFAVEPPADLLAEIRAMPEAHVDLEGRKAALARIRPEANKRLPFLAWIAEGRTPFEVFRDERMLGNSRFDPCSKILKRRLIDAWKQENCDPTETVCVVGIDWTEKHRYTRLAARWQPAGWSYVAPLCGPPYLLKRDLLAWARDFGLEPPRLYALGFTHNNCGGGCVKAGHGHWARLLSVFPDRYAWWERQEEEMRAFLGRDVSMLTDRTGDGHKKPLTLAALRERIDAGGQVPMFDFGGCGCAIDDDEEAS